MGASASRDDGGSARRELLGLLAFYGLLQLQMLLAPGIIERDAEELFSAGQAWLALHGDFGALFAMQYRPFCGGCTVHAATAMGLFSVLPPVALTWKLIPLAWGMLGMGLGWRLVLRAQGRGAARLFALLWVFAPGTWSRLTLIGWGNHMEAGIVGVGALGLALGLPKGERWPAVVLGTVLGFAVYISFSGGFLVLAVLGWLVWQRRIRDAGTVLVAVPLGLVGWLVQWLSAGQHPFHTIYAERESIPDPLRVPSELATLFAPRQLAGLFGAGDSPLSLWLGPVVGGLVVVSGLAGLRGRTRAGRLVGLAMVAFVGVYGLTDFSVKVAEQGVMYAGGLRYAAPWYPVAILVMILMSTSLWRSGRRALAGMVVLPWLVVGVVDRATVAGRGFSTARLHHNAVDWRYVRERLSYVFDAEAHARGATSLDPWTRDLHAYGLGREGFVGPESSRAWHEGRGEAALRMQPRGALPELALLPADTDEMARRAGLLRIWGGISADAWAGPLSDGPDARVWVEGWMVGARHGSESSDLPLMVRPPSGLTADQERVWAEGLGEGLGETGGPATQLRTLDLGTAALNTSAADAREVGIHREWWPPGP